MTSLDYTAIMAGAAVIAIIVSLMIHKRESRQSRLSLAADLVSRLDREFNSEQFREKRKSAATALRKDTSSETRSADYILDFFERVALLTNKGALDREMVWNTFFYWFHRYRHCARDRIEVIRKDDPTIWADFIDPHENLEMMEKRKRLLSKWLSERKKGRLQSPKWILRIKTRILQSSVDVSLTDNEVEEFLNEEMNL